MSNRKGLLALSPLFVFVTIYLVASIIAQDFYKVPISVAFVIASIYAVAISYKNGLRQSVDIFSKGASKSNIMLMLWIFILAGAFAQSAKAMGSVDATVDLMLSLLPDNMLLPGLFLATCFISLSIGTSVGTIVALVPIAAGLAQSTGSPAALLTAVVVGGAFFGDNLSFISDTTIAATSSQRQVQGELLHHDPSRHHYPRRLYLHGDAHEYYQHTSSSRYNARNSLHRRTCYSHSRTQRHARAHHWHPAHRHNRHAQWRHGRVRLVSCNGRGHYGYG